MRRILALTLVSVAVFAIRARADITYQYVTDQSAYTAAAGTNVTVSVFLQETVTGTSKSLLASEGGLFGFGVLVTKTSGDATLPTSGFAVNNAAPPNGFNGNQAQNPNPPTATQVGAIANVGNSTTGVTGTVTGNVTKILLGTVTITATSTNESDFKVGVNTFAPGNTITNTNAFDLDQTNNGPAGGATYKGATDTGPFVFTINAAVVPEPSSMLLCGLIACGGAYSAYRRRKAQKAEAAPPA
jgi:hypothetical protein